MEIDNSAKSAVKTGKWKAPGAAFYDALMDAFSYGGPIPEDAEQLRKVIADGKYKQWNDYLSEAYLVCPLKQITNHGPYGRTPFSRSGCKYPHHVIRNGKLVLSVPGIKAAYARALQMGVLKGDVKHHLERHIKDLGMEVKFKNGALSWNESSAIRIDENFDSIFAYLHEKTGVELKVDADEAELAKCAARMESTIMDALRYFEAAKNGIIKSRCSSPFMESAVEGPKGKEVLTSEITKEIGDIYSVDKLLEWVIANIDYDSDDQNWHLRTAAQLYMDKKGNCHDQSYFTALLLHSWHQVSAVGQLFMVEYKEGQEQGGRTHTTTWYVDKGKYYWLETAWGNHTGIHGPFQDKDDIMDKIHEYWEEDGSDYDGLCFSTLSNYRLGMNLNDYVNAWRIEWDKPFHKDKDYEDEFKYVRITFHGVGVYEALRRAMGPERWKEALQDDRFTWLLKPPSYSGTCTSYFTAEGYKMFLDKLGFAVQRWLTKHDPNGLKIQYYKKPNGKVIYQDKYQVVVDTSQEIQESMDWITEYAHKNDNEKKDTLSSVLKECKTPSDLLNWMKDNISYGWLDENGVKTGTGSHDSSDKMYREYRLQSPAQLVTSGIGVCWDQCELERVWFKYHGYKFAVIFVEIDDDEGKPTHTFLIFHDKGKVKWFESSWGQMGGIHSFPDAESAVKHAVQKFKESQQSKWSDEFINIRVLEDPMPAGTKCLKYYELARKQPKFENVSITLFESTIPFLEGYTLKTLPDKMYFSSSKKLDELKGQVFMSPFIGISSIFIIDRHAIMHKYIEDALGKKPVGTAYNCSYEEWGWPDSKLEKPLDIVHITHNIESIKTEMNGQSTGYIYTVDISKVRDKLKLFKGKQVNREVIYQGNDSLPILNVRKHTVKWEIKFGEENYKHAGPGHVYTEATIPPPPSMGGEDPQPVEQKPSEKESRPKKIDRQESPKNGVRRKNLYIAFIEWCKKYNDKNTFGSIFDEDVFKVSYPFIPHEMRYFYRLANPMMCVLAGDLTFFPVAELRTLNSQ
ncbi:MAG: transglutaminase-like domain-containing protein, partial [Muribaculaceae bacterium]|nr:transglutaminase-like domain-containing protein [Muribaculaceae bacterium]